MNYVTKVFMQVFGYGKDKAHKLMMEVHQTGRSIVWTGAREQAEVYAQKLQAHHLLTTLEVVDG
jgi:ATP-dependent Clp protease adaptor protein ClpS